jgi:hypothetical protein
MDGSRQKALGQVRKNWLCCEYIPWHNGLPWCDVLRIYSSFVLVRGKKSKIRFMQTAVWVREHWNVRLIGLAE